MMLERKHAGINSSAKVRAVVKPPVGKTPELVASVVPSTKPGRVRLVVSADVTLDVSTKIVTMLALDGALKDWR